jgi:hypothetical protein
MYEIVEYNEDYLKNFENFVSQQMVEKLIETNSIITGFIILDTIFGTQQFKKTDTYFTIYCSKDKLQKWHSYFITISELIKHTMANTNHFGDIKLETNRYRCKLSNIQFEVIAVLDMAYIDQFIIKSFGLTPLMNKFDGKLWHIYDRNTLDKTGEVTDMLNINTSIYTKTLLDAEWRLAIEITHENFRDIFLCHYI